MNMRGCRQATMTHLSTWEGMPLIRSAALLSFKISCTGSGFIASKTWRQHRCDLTSGGTVCGTAALVVFEKKSMSVPEWQKALCERPFKLSNGMQAGGLEKAHSQSCSIACYNTEPCLRNTCRQSRPAIDKRHKAFRLCRQSDSKEHYGK
jgi:hypothetical protein